MPHFESSFTDFLKELDANNNREWFAENRRRYETQVKEVFKGFVDKLLPYVREIDPDISISTKDAVFRINRDNRFNQELLPYYTYMRVFFAKGGRRSPFAGFYLKIGHDFINIGGGALFLEKENLKKVRIEIAFNDEEFHSIISNPTFVSTFGQIKGEKSVHIPKEFKEAVKKQPLIANTKFFYESTYQGDQLLQKPDLINFVISHFHTGMQVNQFLKRALEKTNQPSNVRSFNN